VRQQKGLEHGERNTARLEKKIADSKKRSKKVQERAKEWETLNEEVKAKESEKIEAVGGVVVDEVAAKAKQEEDGAKEVEGVEMLDAEQPSEVPVTDEKMQQQEAPVLPTVPVENGKGGDELTPVDEIA